MGPAIPSEAHITFEQDENEELGNSNHHAAYPGNGVLRGHRDAKITSATVFPDNNHQNWIWLQLLEWIDQRTR